jgi:hypothetical protein
MTDDNGSPPKKEKVIHTRVPEHLDQELRRRAEGLGISVSNLVRNALGHAFGLATDVITDSANIVRSVSGAAEASAKAATPVSSFGDAPGRVLGWQVVVFALNAVCARCNTVIARGTDGAIAVTDRPGPKAALCLTCLEEERHGGESEKAGLDEG